MKDDLVERVVWAIVGELHVNVPEHERPMSWSDFSDDQASRVKRAARAAIAAMSVEAVPVAWLYSKKSPNSDLMMRSVFIDRCADHGGYIETPLYAKI